MYGQMQKNHGTVMTLRQYKTGPFGSTSMHGLQLFMHYSALLQRQEEGKELSSWGFSGSCATIEEKEPREPHQAGLKSNGCHINCDKMCQ